MKAVSLFVFAVLCSMTTFANDSIQFEGNDGQSLMNSLKKAGAYVDCGAGTCGTTAADLSCFKSKFKDNSATCTVNVQNETGGLSPKHIKGARAEKLVNLLIDAGVVNCAMESCQGEAISIDCIQSINPEAGDNQVQCAVEVK